MILDSSPTNIAQAAGILQQGGLVAMPTETVYGLAADATDDTAVARIFEAKGRPQFNPLIVHYADVTDVNFDVVMNDRAAHLATVFWPGALTMVLPRQKDARVSLLCSAGLETLAVRVPSHPVARELIQTVGKPLAAPSANASGTLSATTPQHVAQSLGDKVNIILADGKTDVGLESTVIDLSGDIPTILRMGAITPEDIQNAIGAVQVSDGTPDAPKSPGQLLKHYAPRTPLRLQAIDIEDGEALLAFGSTRFMSKKSGGGLAGVPVRNLSESGDLTEAAANLFVMLHELDSENHKAIAVMDIPNTGLGLAMNDRLNRARK